MIRFILLVCSGIIACVLQRRAMQKTANPLLTNTADPRHKNYRTKPASWWGDLIAAGCGCAIYLTFFLLTGRPFFSLAVTGGILIALLLVNQAKERELQEPLVLADACLISQIIRYPHLYFPFLPTRQLSVYLLVTFTILAGSLWIETPVSWSKEPLWISATILCLLLPLIFLFTMSQGKLPHIAETITKHIPITADPVTDALLAGPLAAALLHIVLRGKIIRNNPDYLRSAHQQPNECHWPLPVCIPPRDIPRQEMPHIVLIQAESFCDLRTATRMSIPHDFLPNWDRLKAANCAFTPPDHAFGAYTMRQEFHVLTGLGPKVTGPFWHNPYLLASRRSLWSLARLYNQLGYKTICVHPYAAHFFRRDRVMPRLGFQHFYDITSLPPLATCGPYTSDIALASWIVQTLQQSTQPVFCFAITMEAHGPWLPGRLTTAEKERIVGAADWFTSLPEEIQLYLCHIKNTDTMLGILMTQTQQMPRPTHLTVYGDHFPNLSATSLKVNN